MNIIIKLKVNKVGDFQPFISERKEYFAMKSRKIVAVLLAVLMLVTAMPMTGLAAIDYTTTENIRLISDTTTAIAPGITEDKIITNNESGTAQVVGYAVTLDMSNPTIGLAAGYADYNGNTWKMQTVRAQANAYMKATGNNVVVAVNADIYNMQTGAPLGVLVMGGKVYNKGIGKPYLGVTKSGEIVMGSSLTEAVLSTLQEATGGFYTLLENGVRVNQDMQPITVPKTAVGRKADGTIVIYSADGRNFPVSNGLTDYDLTSIMIGLGCVDVFNLDGGGSTTYLARVEGDSSLSLRNRPSDGIERSVATSLFVTSSAKPSGEFDHATLSPKGQLYTPGSTVQFTATGVDSSGAKADLPADGTFALADESFGSITADGKFVSTGKTGTVTANYISGGAVCGTTEIEVVVPDTLYVPNNEVSLGFEETTTFGLVAKYQTKDVNLKDDDIIWTITDENGADLGTEAGVFSGLTFTSVDGKTITGYITATLACDTAVKTNIKAIIGAQPVVIYDFEYTTDAAEAEASNGEMQYVPSYSMPRYDRSNPDAHAVQGTAFYEQGYPLYCWPNASLNDQDSMKATVVSKADGEPVRFGQKSLRIDFNYESYNGSSNSNNYLRVAGPNVAFDGTPTAIGMWMYVPEGISNFMVYYQCGRLMKDDAGNVVNGSSAYAPVCEINPDMYNKWTYLEFNLVDPPAGSSGGGLQNAPFGIQHGGGIIWISFQTGNHKGDRSASRIYIDNYQVVYGANTDDITNPVINSVGILGGDEIADGKTVLTSATNNFVASYADIEEKYATGIDYSEVKMAIDGVDVTDSCFINTGDNQILLYDKTLSNGVHNIDITVADKFGNTSTETRYFTVEAESDATSVSLSPVGSPILGRDYVMEVVPTDSTVKEAEISLKAISKFVSYWNDLSVVPGDNYELVDGYKYDTATDSIVFKAVKKADASSDDTVVARIVAAIPNNIPENLECTYRITKGDITLDDGTKTSFSGKIVTTVLATYNISTSVMVAGSDEAEIYVTDTVGTPAADVAVYTADGTTVGVTDENGVVKTSMFLDAAQSVTLYAEKDGGRSFNFTTQVYADGGNADGTPAIVKLNATKDNETTQNVSWMSSVVASAEKAVAKIATKADYEANGEAALKEVEGTSVVTEFPSSGSIEGNYAARINSVTFTGLKADTEYVYVVGDGEKMTEIKSFKTVKENRAVNFFVIGDTQADDVTNTENITKALAGSDVTFDFGLQTGDLVDNGGNYKMWEKIASVISNDYTGALDIISGLGNHEYYGDVNGTVANKYLGLNGENDTAPLCYSVTYGNVYFVVLNYANDGNYAKLLDWIKDDAAKSDAQWKILVSHQPAYYTNPGGTSETVANGLRTIVDTVGFDIMLSGHDHSYARTLPMKGGEVDENGTTYFICGSTGEKSYSIIDNKSFNFEKLLGTGADSSYNAIYLSVSTTDSELKITAYDCGMDGNSTVIDTFTKKKEVCANSEHKFVLGTDGYFKCSVCNYAVLAESLNYTGFVTDETTGKNMYLLNGEKQTGWLTYIDDVYYFDENGLAVTGKKTIPVTVREKTENVTFTFDENGAQVGYVFHKCADGYTRAYRGNTFITGWREIDGNWYFFTSSQETYGRMYVGTVTINLATGQKVKYTFDSKGHLQGTSWYTYDDGSKVLYYGPKTLTGWQTVDGVKYYMDPETGFVVTGDIEIDGVMYSFLEDGRFAHSGDHADVDGDGKCDACEAAKKAAKGSFLDRLLAFFRRIINWFMKLFNIA